MKSGYGKIQMTTKTDTFRYVEQLHISFLVDIGLIDHGNNYNINFCEKHFSFCTLCVLSIAVCCEHGWRQDGVRAKVGREGGKVGPRDPGW